MVLRWARAPQYRTGIRLIHPLDAVSRGPREAESKGHRLAASDAVLQLISWISRRPGPSYELARALAWCSFLYKRDFLRSAFLL